MASGIGLSLDTSFLQSLENADNKIKELTDKTNALSRATIQAFQQMANGGVVPYIEQLNRQKKALEEVGKIKGSSPFLTKMQADAKVAVDEINNLIKTLEKTKAYKGEMSGRTAISFANSVLGQRGEAKSIDNMKLAISQLEAAQNRLNLNTKTGQKNYEKIQETINKVKAELDKATGANKDLTEESKKTADAMEKTGRRISAAFALNAISAFARQLREIRGEFEIQHKSLQVLLQDVDKANVLWEKTTALAVKSPYRVKELVTYTKQLAAYRIESEKLYDTNKMLADVASGLGVDMNRLILAFGQVKAANFLRGTELRQFSEAGVNLLEELSKRFTELEGRAVSVGDVFERVSKRMVTFEDVEAVFKTITSEGGVFYQMQEKQSETVKGMWENIKDSVDLAFNEIGQSGDTSLKTILKLTKEIVDNWRKFIPIIAGAGVTFLTYFSTTTLMGIGKAVTSLAGPWGLVAGAVLGVAAAIVTAIKATKELTAAMNRIDMEVSGQLEDSVALYIKLTKAINNVTTSEKERNKALDQLKAKFADILPDQMLELEYIQDIADNYSEATDAMMNYYTAKAREQKKDKVESHYAEEIEGTDIPELITATRDAINKLGEKGVISQDMQLALLGSIQHAINTVTEKVKGGEISAEYNSMRNAIFAELEKYSGYKGSLFDDLLNINTVRFDEQIKDISITLSDLRRDLENIPQFSFGSYAKDEAAKVFVPEKENIEQAKSILNSMISDFTELSQQATDSWGDADEAIFDMIGNLPPEMSAYAELLSNMFEKLKIAATKGRFEFKAAIQGIEQDFKFELPTAIWTQVSDDMFSPLSEGIREELAQLVTNTQDTLNREAQSLDLTDFQKSVVKVFRDVASEMKGVDLNVFTEFIPDLKKSRGEIIEELNALESQYTDTVAAWDKSISEGVTPMMAEHIHQISEAEIAQMRANIPALDEAAKRLGEIEKETKKNDNTIEERIKVVDQMNKKYLELNKTLSKTESMEGAFEAYKDAFATAYGREDVRAMSAEEFAKNVLNFPDENAIITWLDNLANTVKEKEDKFKVQIARGKFEMDVDVRLKKDADEILKNEIEAMFDRYDLTLDLKKLDLPEDLAEQLFDIDYLDLDELRAAIKARESEFIGTDMEDQYKDYLDKIDEMERKAIIERTKVYSEYLVKGMNERVKLKVEELKKLKELEESQEFTPDQKKIIREQIRKDSKKDEDKLAWKDFKATDMYTMMFSDLENLGNEAIQNLYNNLDELKSSLQDLDPSEVKEIVTQMEKLQQQMIERNPFEALKKAREDIKGLASEESLQIRLLDIRKEEENAQEIIDLIDTVQNAFATGTSDVLSVDTLSAYNDFLREQDALPKEQRKTMAQIREEQVAIVEKAKEEGALTEEQLGRYRTLRSVIKGNADAWGEIGNSVDSALGSAMDIMTSLGVESDGAAMAIAEGAKNMIALVFQAVQYTLQMQAAGVAANSALGPIGWILLALQGIATIISSIANAKNAVIDEQLERQAKLIERQRDLYEDIEEKVETAYSVSQLRQYNGELERTVELEIEALEASIALEKSRKKADEGQISDWEKQIAEARKRLAETKQEIAEEMGGIFDLTDFTSGFVDAWWDAMDEGMSGLDALGEHFEETMKDMVKKQALFRGAQEIMKQVQEVINADIADNYQIDDWQKIWDVAKKANVDLDAFLQGWYDMFGAMSDGAGGSLSALQKGIQGITEDTAQVIEAYLNSIRGYVSEQVAYTRRLYEMFDRMSHGTTYGLNVRMIS